MLPAAAEPASDPVSDAAARATLPLQFDHGFIEQVLQRSVFTGPGQRRRVVEEAGGCRLLELSDPRLSSAGKQLRLRTAAFARVGTALAGRCLTLTEWRGQLEILQRVEVRDGDSLHLTVEDTRLLTADGEVDTVADAVWQWTRQYVAPAMNTRVVDLADPLAQIEAVVGDWLASRNDASADPVGIHLSGARVTPTGIAAELDIRVDAPNALPRTGGAHLTPAELTHLQQQLDFADEFFTQIAKTVAGHARDPDLRQELLGALLQARMELVHILAGGDRAAGRDAARHWFVGTWRSVAPLLRQVSNALPEAQGLAYLSFIAAGDALEALDRLAPALGLEVSEQGLRRLARLLLQHSPANLQPAPGVDPELRRRFGFGAALETPAPAGPFSWLIRAAQAKEIDTPEKFERLNTWIPQRDQLDDYLPLAGKALLEAAQRQIRAGKLDKAYEAIFRRLVLSAAWQESCWRQFMEKDRKRVPLQSSTGDVGVMQINLRVWRGFYDAHRLKWEFFYNAHAGAEILRHYFEKYALRHAEHTATGDVHNLARSAYAAYNGGPRAYDRYRRKDAPSYGRRVDRDFHAKYVSMADEKIELVKGCYGE